MSLEDWQVALRREFGRAQQFKVENLGDDPIFSTFRVRNSTTGGVYEVKVRGRGLGDNRCSCPDFAINTLGTCKHIEFVLARLERKRGGKRRLSEAHQPEDSEVYLRYSAQREVVLQPGRTMPPTLRRLARDYFDAAGLLKAAATARFERFLLRANEAGHAVRCDDDVLTYIARMRDRASLRERVAQAFPGGADSTALNKLLTAPLYPYQREGALFAAKAGRSLIADDMGLGKTIQAIAAAEILARHGGAERVLIVCPTSLKHQWESEIQRFARREAEQVQVIGGPIAERHRTYLNGGVYKITNYDVIHRDLEAIERWSPDLVILDEAQRIKNWQTRAARSVKQLESPYAIVLTGTPLENRLEELYSIVEFVDRYRLGPMFRFLHEHQHVDETGRVIGYRKLDRISRTLEPILLRRRRAEVLKELPPRLEKRLFVPMTPQQQLHHDENRENVARLVAKWRRNHFLSDADQRRLMAALQNMRMVCDSTYLLDPESDHGVKGQELERMLEEVLEDPDAKVVIFSQWLGMHELIAARLKARSWDHVLFHGGVPSKRRNELVQRFRSERDCRCFLSTDAGGVGLNLQHANVVINVDQPWNPAVLEQRIGRVHRLGQRQPVRVVNLIAQGTIEHSMLGLVEFKRSMFTGVLDGGPSEVFLGGSRLKRFMNTVEQATGGIPAPMARDEPESVSSAEASAATQQDAVQGNGQNRGRAAGDADDAWSELAAAGLTLLEKLRRAMDVADGHEKRAARDADPIAALVRRDEQNGERYLRIPLPDRQMVERLTELVKAVVR